jgi:DNA polymerase (family 10)
LDKRRAAAVLQEVAALLELNGANPFKVRAFTNAARSILSLEDDLEILVRERRLSQIPGIGKGLERDLTELVSTGSLRAHEELRASMPAGLTGLLRVPGLGPKKVRLLWEKLQIGDLDALEAACRTGRLSELEGFGEKTEQKILEGLEYARKFEGRVLWSVAHRIGSMIREELEKHPRVARVAVAGSIRRCVETVHDVDLLASVEEEHREEVMTAFTKGAWAASVAGRGPTKSSVITLEGLQVDLRAVSEMEFPFALHHFTGSKEHNTKLRGMAKARGLKMSEWGMFRGEDLLPARDEAEVFALLDLPYIPPEMRENQGEIEAALSGALPRLVDKSSIRGVLHAHTTASDGKATLREMAEGARERGFEFLGIADHSPSAFYANGLDAGRLRVQGAEIRALNAQNIGLTILHGAESDIRDDGSLDFDDDVLATLDFVVASIHSRFGMPQDAMTERILTAIRHPAVAVLGHLTGRRLLQREGYEVDVDRILEEAGRLGVAIEINGHPQRLDLDWRHLRRAVSLGVTLSIGPDAHSVADLDHTWIGLGIARKGWLEPGNLLNCGSVEDVLSFCRRRRENWRPESGARSRYGAQGERIG